MRKEYYEIREIKEHSCSKLGVNRNSNSQFSARPHRKIGLIEPLYFLAFLSFSVFLVGCESTSFRVPPAQTPQFVSSGLNITGGSGATTTTGELNPFCNDFTVPSGPYGRGIYVTVKMPTLNTPEVTFAGILGDYWGEFTDPAEQSLSQGPRPITQEQIQQLQGNYIGYFIHDDFLTGSDYHVVIGILLGSGVPESGTLAIRSVNSDPQNTGLQARSNPLDIAIAGPIRVTGNVSPNPVSEGQPVTVSWNATNADQVEITGPGFASGTALPVNGSQTVTAECTGDRDSASTSYQIKALRVSCPTARAVTQNLSSTVNTSRIINQFEGVPLRPLEGSAFTLRWNTAGASSVALTGPNGFSHNATGPMGQTSVTAPPVAQCLSLQNFNYQMTATWPACGPRTETALVSVTTATQRFTLVESGGSRCQSSNQCIVGARSLNEARSCASSTCGAIQQGCTWR